MLFTYASGEFMYDGKAYELTIKNIQEVFKTELPFGTSASAMVEKVQELGGVIAQTPLEALGFEGKPAGYMIVFCVCAVAYLIGWSVMKLLVPKYKPVVID